MTYRTGQEPVPYEEAVRRVRSLPENTELRASHLANLIWPGHRMSPQGSALAAGRFIRWMLRDRVITPAGLGYAVCRVPPRADSSSALLAGAGVTSTQKRAP